LVIVRMTLNALKTEVKAIEELFRFLFSSIVL